jgi:hypothetical protein
MDRRVAARGNCLRRLYWEGSAPSDDQIDIAPHVVSAGRAAQKLA